ncbi:MAG: hypothetical protein ABIG68_01395, partial [Acidobacteriota bacterium]
RYRYGSALPVAGYYEKRGEDYFITDRRNLERYPVYGRLDLRANHTFTHAAHTRTCWCLEQSLGSLSAICE